MEGIGGWGGGSAVEEGKEQILNGFICQVKEFRLPYTAAKKTVRKD